MEDCKSEEATSEDPEDGDTKELSDVLPVLASEVSVKEADVAEAAAPESVDGGLATSVALRMPVRSVRAGVEADVVCLGARMCGGGVCEYYH